MENLSKKATNLSPEQLELLKKKVSKKAIKNENTNCKISPVISEDGCFPLSCNQERLWLSDRTSIGSTVAGMIKLQGLLDSEALKNSIYAVSKRHEVLKYVFRNKDKQHIQMIHESSAPYFGFAYIEEQYLNQKDFDIQKFITAEIKSTTWNMENGPLFKLKIIKLSEKEHLMLIIAHSLIFDISSINIFLDDLTNYYELYCEGEVPKSEELTIQYAHYAYWQRQMYSKDIYRKSHDYWMDKIKRINAADNASAQTMAFANENILEMVSFKISSDMVKELKAMARREGVTLYMLLLAAFYSLLYKYNRQKEVCIGSCAENRNSVELEKMIGSFETEMAFLINFSENMNFRELLYSVRDEVLETYKYQEMPIGGTNEHQVAVDISSDNFICRNMFFLNNQQFFAKEVKGLSVELFESYHELLGKDLTLSLNESQQELSGILKYYLKVFEEETVLKMVDNFQYILSEIIKNPSIGLTDMKVNNECKENYSEIEEKLITIWKDVLNCERVGVNDNFFEIGGNSLRLVRMHEAIEEIYPGKITIAKLFSYPTVSGLASFIEAEAIEDTDMNVPVTLLPLPLDFFINEGDENEDIVLKAYISGEVYDNLLEVSRDIEIASIDTLLAVYTYLLSETIGQQQVTVQTMIDSNELVYPLSMNMENITDFSELFKSVYKKRNSVDESDTYPLKIAGSMQLTKADNSIMTMFTNEEVSKDELMVNYDIIIKVNESSEGISLTCEYNADRLKKDKIQELLSNYINLIKILIERMI